MPQKMTPLKHEVQKRMGDDQFEMGMIDQRSSHDEQERHVYVAHSVSRLDRRENRGWKKVR